jgi:hypothetical protein
LEAALDDTSGNTLKRNFMRSRRKLLLTTSLVAAITAIFGAEQKERSRDSLPRALGSYDPQVNEVLGQMTLEEKIGQMTQPDQQSLKSIDDIETFHLGSLLSGGDSDPKSGNDLHSWRELYNRYQSRALRTRLHIPLLYGIDAVHGNNNVIGAVMFPHNIGLAALATRSSWNESVVRRLLKFAPPASTGRSRHA